MARDQLAKKLPNGAPLVVVVADYKDPRAWVAGKSCSIRSAGISSMKREGRL
mgnify:CR=1 FL=1